MKDIKLFAIGFLTCACFVLITGQTRNLGHNFNDSIGKYQGYADGKNKYLVDTRTGETFKRECEIPDFGCRWEYFVSSKN